METDLKNTNSLNIANCIADNDWIKVEEYFNNSAFLTHLGITVSLDNPDLPRCEISHLEPFHLGGIGQNFVNGAIISSILDLSVGLTALKYSKMGKFATSSLNIEMARPVDNGRFYAISKRNRIIGKKLFSEATIFNSNDEPCVYASGILRIGINNA